MHPPRPQRRSSCPNRIENQPCDPTITRPILKSHLAAQKATKEALLKTPHGTHPRTSKPSPIHETLLITITPQFPARAVVSVKHRVIPSHLFPTSLQYASKNINCDDSVGFQSRSRRTAKSTDDLEYLKTIQRRERRVRFSPQTLIKPPAILNSRFKARIATYNVSRYKPVDNGNTHSRPISTIQDLATITLTIDLATSLIPLPTDTKRDLLSLLDGDKKIPWEVKGWKGDVELDVVEAWRFGRLWESARLKMARRDDRTLLFERTCECGGCGWGRGGVKGG